MNPLGLKNVNNITSAYAKATKPIDKIALESRSFLQNKFNFEVTGRSKKT